MVKGEWPLGVLPAAGLECAWHAALWHQIACLTAACPHRLLRPARRSATSGVSGTSGLSDGDGTGDFKRGKRYKKLIKLIDSPDSKKVRAMSYMLCMCDGSAHLRTLSLQRLRKFKMLVAAVIFTCMAVHVLCFALIMDAIHVSILASEMNACCNPVTVLRSCTCSCLRLTLLRPLASLFADPQWQNDALVTLTNMGDGQRDLQKVLASLLVHVPASRRSRVLTPCPATHRLRCSCGLWTKPTGARAPTTHTQRQTHRCVARTAFTDVKHVTTWHLPASVIRLVFTVLSLQATTVLCTHLPGALTSYSMLMLQFFASEMYRYLNQYNDMNNG